MQAMSDLLDTEVQPEPSHAHALGCAGDGRVIVPRESHPGLTPETGQSEPAEAYHFDRTLHAMVAGLTGGISPIALSLAYIDWAAHLAAAPQRQLAIAQDALRGANAFLQLTRHCLSPSEPWSLIRPQPQDRRFAEPEWERAPFNLIAQEFLLQEQWWHQATTGVRGVAARNEAIVEFSVRQLLDMLAPSNFAVTNPEVLDKVFRSGGENFVFGWQNWLSDWMQLLSAGTRALDKDLSSAKPSPRLAARWCSETISLS